VWKRLASKLQITSPRGAPFRKPTADELAEFAQRHGFRFPPSYVKFVQSLGAGTLCDGYFVIVAPDFGMEKEFECRGNELLAEIYSDSDFVARMIPFGGNGSGDIFAWDPMTITKRRPLEYRVYVLPRDEPRIVPLCDSFPQFVREVCLGQGLFLALYGRPDPDWTVHFTFDPIRPQRRKDRYLAPRSRTTQGHSLFQDAEFS
jgi:hypothetical protein